MRLTGGQYLSVRSAGTGNAASSREYARFQSSVDDVGRGVRRVVRAGCRRPGYVAVADPLDLGADRDHRVDRSGRSRARSSDSVGSIISVPATGNDIVGAWKP